MRYAAEEAQVEVLLVGGNVHVPCLHRGKQFVVVCLSFAAADDLADAGDEKVGRRHRLAVGVLLHIEGLDLLGVVGDEHGALEDDFGEVFFVFGLKVAAPVDGVLELDVRLLQDGDGVRIIADSEIARCDVFEFVFEPLFDKAVEESDLIGAFVEHGADEIFDHIFCDLDDVGKFCKGDFGFDVPELCDVPRRVGVLRAEGGSEGVDLAERHRGDFALELPRNGEPRLDAEEVVLVIVLLALILGVVGLGGDAEHLPCALAVARRDDGRMDVVIAVLVEVAVHGLRRDGTHAEHGVEGVGAKPQVRDAAQEFQRGALLLDGIFGRAFAEEHDFLRVELMPFSLERLDDFALD